MLVAATGGQFLGGDNEHSSRHRSCCRHCRMAYTPPSRAEIRYLIQVHWRQHADPSKQSNADDADFVEAKVASTQHLLQRFIRGGMDPHVAESRAMKPVALA